MSNPSQVEGNVVLSYLDAVEEDSLHPDELKTHYRRGGLGDQALKHMLEARLQEMLALIRACRHQPAEEPEQINDIVREGAEVARQGLGNTLAEVRRALSLNYFCR